MTILNVPSSTNGVVQTRAPAKTKVLHAVRHGITEMNTYLSKNKYYLGMKDPMLWDTKLTPEGIAGARRATSVAAKLAPQAEILIVSPLSRAIHTADLVFPHYDGPTLVEPLARERLYLSSDAGSSPQVLEQTYGRTSGGRWDFSHMEETWWHAPAGPRPKDSIPMEPEEAFRLRVAEFKAFLLARPETVIAVVAHWGLLYELTGHQFENCEVKSFEVQAEGVCAMSAPYTMKYTN